MERKDGYEVASSSSLDDSFTSISGSARKRECMS